MTLGFAHLKVIVVIVAAVVLYLLAEAYHLPISAVLLCTCTGAILAAAWDKLTSITA